jgi:hypothetical protein
MKGFVVFVAVVLGVLVLGGCASVREVPGGYRAVVADDEWGVVVDLDEGKRVRRFMLEGAADQGLVWDLETGVSADGRPYIAGLRRPKDGGQEVGSGE